MLLEIKGAIATANASTLPLIITDVPKRAESYRLPRNQLSFKVKADNGSLWTTTYFFAQGIDPRVTLRRFKHHVDSHPKLLAKLVFALYSQEFEFAGSTKGAVAFLHDHIELHRVIRRITFRYRIAQNILRFETQRGRITVPATHSQDFRRFSNIPVWKLSGLKSYKLIIEKEFWDEAPWQWGALLVYGIEDLCQEESFSHHRPQYRNFLQHIARICKKVSVVLRIEGADDKEKKAFVSELTRIIHERRDERRDLVTDRDCVCRAAATADGVVERCCVYELPLGERIYGVPSEAPKHDEEGEKDKKSESEKLRKANDNPPPQIAIEFLKGLYFMVHEE